MLDNPVLAGSLARRTSEFGVRIALGAEQGEALNAELGYVAVNLGAGLFGRLDSDLRSPSGCRFADCCARLGCCPRVGAKL
jgi:hypothetical protein